MSQNVKMTCPHCSAALTVDVEAGVVVHHEPPKSDKPTVDLDAKLEELKANQARAADKMEEALRKEKDRDRLMAEKFSELMKGAADKDDGTPPLKPIDLD